MDRGVAKLISAYERGVVTRDVAVNNLLQLAVDVPPADLAADLPADWVVELQENCEKLFPCPPAGGMLFISSACNRPGYDADRERRESEDRWRAGLSAWQAYFGGIGAG